MIEDRVKEGQKESELYASGVVPYCYVTAAAAVMAVAVGVSNTSDTSLYPDFFFKYTQLPVYPHSIPDTCELPSFCTYIQSPLPGTVSYAYPKPATGSLESTRQNLSAIYRIGSPQKTPEITIRWPVASSIQVVIGM